MPYKDPVQQKAAQRRHYEQNKAKMIARSTQWKRDQRQKMRAIFNEAKSQPCADCGHTYPPYIMDFDHVRGTKECNVGNMITRAVSLARLYAEIDKCEVVCSNCHRERTHQRRIKS